MRGPGVARWSRACRGRMGGRRRHPGAAHGPGLAAGSTSPPGMSSPEADTPTAARQRPGESAAARAGLLLRRHRLGHAASTPTGMSLLRSAIAPASPADAAAGDARHNAAPPTAARRPAQPLAAGDTLPNRVPQEQLGQRNPKPQLGAAEQAYGHGMRACRCQQRHRDDGQRRIEAQAWPRMRSRACMRDSGAARIGRLAATPQPGAAPMPGQARVHRCMSAAVAGGPPGGCAATQACAGRCPNAATARFASIVPADPQAPVWLARRAAEG
jgi:hypothetical protein